MSRKELIRYFNQDIPDEQLDEMLGELKEEQEAEEVSEQPIFEGLKRLGSISS